MGSRYYVPDWCRWLNADDPAYLDFFNPSCINLFAYCGNDPIGKSYDCFGDGENSYYSMEVSSIGVSLPEIPQWMNHVSKFNDTFSSVFHSATVGYYLFKNLGFADDMLMQGVNLATALSKLPNASWLKKLGLVFSVIDAGIAIYDNLQQGNTLGRALLDGGLTFCKGMASAYVGGLVGANVGGMIGAALGSLIPIPGLGAFIGFVVGTGVGIVVSWFVDDVLGLIKDGIMDITFG